MTTFDPLTAPLSHLFLRVDAALPSDPVLLAAAEHWLQRRGGKLMPARGEMKNLPTFILPHAFYANLAINGDQHWIVSAAGPAVRQLFAIRTDEPDEVPDKRMAVRLRRLFDLVAERSEPYSVMFEVPEPEGGKRLVEIYAAPLSASEKAERQIFAVVNSRIEAMR